jgi:excisionase family DNA binding protein
MNQFAATDADGRDAPGVLMDAKHVAAKLSVKPRTVYSLVDQGLLPYHRVGKRLIRFTQADVDELFRRSAELAP